MGKSRARGRAASGPADSDRRGPAWLPLLPALLAAALAVPTLSFGYFWDDYLFLTCRGTHDPTTFLFPEPGAAFYRPVAQGLYFQILRALDPANGALAHVLNLAALVAAVLLLTALVSRLAGSRAGLYAGLAFAGVGAVPSLVAWVSCSQDLFAMVFMLAAMLLRHERKDLAAVGCAAIAVLSKEPAVVVLPILAGWDWIVGRRPERPWIAAGGAAVVLLGWVAVHPGLQVLFGRGFASGATGYLGLESPERWARYLARYLAALANLAPPGFEARWPAWSAIFLPAGWTVLVAATWYESRRAGHAPAAAASRRAALLGALVAVPSLLMPALLIRHWAPYFVCIPAVGAAIAAGPYLARLRGYTALGVLALLLLLGVRYRGAQPVGEAAWTEAVFADAAEAVRRVRADFRFLFPTLPKGTQVVVSTGPTGPRGIHGTLVANHALQVWYGDPTIRAVTTRTWRPGAASEILVRVTSELEILAIDPDTHRVRTTTPRSPDLFEIYRPLRNYARSVAAAGDTERALRILGSFERALSPELRPYNERTMAMILLGAARRAEARAILDAVPPVGRQEALYFVKRLLAEATASADLDEQAFEAFGLSGRDPGTIRWLMREYGQDGLPELAAWYALRLDRLVPADPEAAAVVEAARREGSSPARFVE